MASRKIDDCIPTLKNAWRLAEKKWEEQYPERPKPFLTCTYRSNEEQNDLYNQGRINKKPKVTNAKGGQSPHNYTPSFAFDIAFITIEKKLDWNTRLFSDFSKLISEIEPKMEWGGSWVSFKDNPHFELRNWKDYLKL
jgi:peptidoglycan L-alanyl-D-glutamate endopeptidase CwlK